MKWDREVAGQTSALEPACHRPSTNPYTHCCLSPRIPAINIIDFAEQAGMIGGCRVVSVLDNYVSVSTEHINMIDCLRCLELQISDNR